MENELTKVKIVLVKWYGQCQKPIDTARFAYMSDLYLNNKETLSVGFVLAEDDKALVLASDIHKNSDNPQSYMVERIITIPKSMLIEVKELS